MNPSFISILEGLQAVFPLFLFVVIGKIRKTILKMQPKMMSSFSGIMIAQKCLKIFTYLKNLSLFIPGVKFKYSSIILFKDLSFKLLDWILPSSSILFVCNGKFSTMLFCLLGYKKLKS
jgi:hypothetical protein